MLESPVCYSVSQTIHTLRATSRQSVLISYVEYHFEADTRTNTGIQKIRTIELDGKTVKLQIVRLVVGHAAGMWRWLTMTASGTLPAKNASEQSLPHTTVALTVFALSTM